MVSVNTFSISKNDINSPLLTFPQYDKLDKNVGAVVPSILNKPKKSICLDSPSSIIISVFISSTPNTISTYVFSIVLSLTLNETKSFGILINVLSDFSLAIL